MKPNLDIYQQSVVFEKANLLVIAGPGSGKTTTIIQKVNYLLNSCNPEDILLISFTNKSVEDIKRKLNSNIFVCTFHKLAIDILKYNNINYKLASLHLLDYIINEYFMALSKKEKEKLCVYLNILNLNENAQEYLSFKNLIKTFINLFKTNNHDFNKLHNLITNYQDKYLIKIIFDILNKYEEEKNSTSVLDFDDLITKATFILNQNYHYHKFKYIIIDEFQDTSLIRLNLVLAIYKGCSCTITVVGDDAQSIYHFSGCDLNIFLNFQKYFSNTKTIFLKNTYRNSQELIDISSKFINKNTKQITKNMQSTIHEKKPIEIIYYFNPIKKFKKVLDKVFLLSNDILILVRNKKDICKYLDHDIKLKDDYLIYKENKLRFLTIHSSKGLESDYVIILNVSNKKYGIPNQIENHPILNYLENDIDLYPYAEERRVFFVAITRCKYKTYLLVPFNNPSIFIKEIK